MNLTFSDAPYFIVPLAIVLIWLAFIWRGRGILVTDSFKKLYKDYLVEGSDTVPFFDSGKFYSSAVFGGCTVSLYGQYTVIGTRFAWYTVIAFDENNTNTRTGFYGKGLALDYLQNTNQSLEMVRKEVLPNNIDIPEGWEFLVALNEKTYYFYRMPDFFGLSPMEEIFDWFSGKQHIVK